MNFDNVAITDNFLPKDELFHVQNIFLGSDINWFFYPYITHKDKGNLDPSEFQFVHTIYDVNRGVCSNYSQDIFNFFFEKLNIYVLLRIKANLTTCSNQNKSSEFHTDFLGNIIENSITSIFYINSNNGYTIFEDGTKIESVSNRLITFPSYLKHTGVSCTDEKTRVVLNFNYFK
jgi:hypothetical protein